MHRPVNSDASNGVCSIYHQMNQFMGYNYSNRTRLLGLKASSFPNANTNIHSTKKVKDNVFKCLLQ